VADGAPADVLKPTRLSEVYGARVEVLHRAGGPAVVPVPSHANAYSWDRT
jgi:iron complex transport system ATP-binding protein